MSALAETAGLNGKDADTLAADSQHPKPPLRTGRTLLWTAGSIALFVILALGLGIGLGLGLKNKSNHGLSPAPATGTDGPSPSGAGNPVVPIPTALPAWRLPPSDYHLSMDWDLNAAPTTRVYNFTVGEIQAGPDGTPPPSPPPPH
jgi:hypothetical protein